MTDLSFSVPSPMHSQIEQRAAQAGYADVGTYVRNLIERDLKSAADEIDWLRTKVAEGLASGISEEKSESIIESIIARRTATRD